MNIIYADNNAPRESPRKSPRRCRRFHRDIIHPSSMYEPAKQAAQAIARRQEIARHFGLADPRQILFNFLRDGKQQYGDFRPAKANPNRRHIITTRWSIRPYSNLQGISDATATSDFLDVDEHGNLDIREFIRPCGRTLWSPSCTPQRDRDISRRTTLAMTKETTFDRFPHRRDADRGKNLNRFAPRFSIRGFAFVFRHKLHAQGSGALHKKERPAGVHDRRASGRKPRSGRKTGRISWGLPSTTLPGNSRGRGNADSPLRDRGRINRRKIPQACRSNGRGRPAAQPLKRLLPYVKAKGCSITERFRHLRFERPACTRFAEPSMFCGR